MPYIAIKSYPKDEETKKRVVEKINQVFLEEWGCKPQALTISLEEVQPENWEDQVRKPQIEQNEEYLMIKDGERLY